MIQGIELVDLSGKVVYEKGVSGENITIEISSLKKGLYLMKVLSENGYEVIRIEKL
ncbi:hypothetical protein D3C71_435620 [compost metagenome]